MYHISYNAMFKAVFSNNKYMLSRLVQAVLDYLEFNVNVMDKELIIKNNELSLSNVHNKQLVCDYLIKLNDNMELNIEMNKSYYPGLEERNMGYCFKIYNDHFKSGDEYDKFEKYFLVQVNFNNFSNPGKEIINQFYLLDVKNPKNYLTKNVCILNVDIASCKNIVYNEGKLKEMSDLEKFGAIFKCTYLEDISYILGRMIDMKEKDKFLNQVKDMSRDEEMLASMKYEDNMDYRFTLVEEDALERGKEQNTIDMIKNMLANHVDLDFISKITGKSIEEIEKIANSSEDSSNLSEDEEMLASMKYEDNMDYRFTLIEEDALERGREQGIEQNTINMIKSMLVNHADLDFISKVTGKSIEEIKEIADSVE